MQLRPWDNNKRSEAGISQGPTLHSVYGKDPLALCGLASYLKELERLSEGKLKFGCVAGLMLGGH